jgi:hypothetical protein
MFEKMPKRMRNVIIILVVILVVILFIGCSSNQNICKKSFRINGEVMYALPTAKHTRTVTMKTENGIVVIYRVPLEQPLTNIPVCWNRGKLFWVMP